MPKFFCDYCDVYLTHDSMSVRKAHNSGRNHLRNVVDYYQQIGHEKAQSVIDSITSSYADAGQAAQNPMLQTPMVGPGGFGAYNPFAGTSQVLKEYRVVTHSSFSGPGGPMPPRFNPMQGGRKSQESENQIARCSNFCRRTATTEHAIPATKHDAR
jgi:U1 small nuclear ribonucleoprotein C